MAPRYAQLVREARAGAGLSQRELARRAGTSQAVISAYENGQREPGFAQLERLLAAAGYKVHVSLRPTASQSRSRAPLPLDVAESDEDDDRILENLRLTPAERLRKMGALRHFASRYRGALSRQA